MTDIQPPRDNIVRAFFPGVEVRAAEKAGGMPTLVGHFAVFNQWTPIDSAYEGRFMERIAPGAFKKTFAENRNSMRVTLNHGSDPQHGDKPLGPIAALEEDEQGARYEVPLLDTTLNRDLVPGLMAGLYGSSFRFQVVKEDFDQRAKPSPYNPDGWPERTIREASVREFGPVTYPAYPGATAGVRSMTDSYLVERLAHDPAQFAALRDALRPRRSLADLATFLLADPTALRTAIDKLGSGEPLLAQEAELLEAAIEHLEPPEADGDDMEENALPKVGAERAHSDDESRVEPEPPAPVTPPIRRFRSREDWMAYLENM